MEPASPSRFADLLSAAIHATKRREGKPIAVIQDELGYAIGKQGGSMVEFWRKGNLPGRRQDLEALARLLVVRGKMDRAWLRDLLDAADYGVGTTAFCDSIFAPLIGAIPSPSPFIPVTIFQAPALPPHFVGRRDEVEAIQHDLVASALPSVALVGMGGVGKSTLAAQMAHSLRHKFPDGVLWVYAVNAEPLDILQNWAQLFGYDFRTIADTENRAAAVRGIWHGKRVLIVLDDVRTPEQMRPLLPSASSCSVILTTRDRDLATLANAKVVAIRALTDAHSLELLNAVLGSERVERERIAAQTIAQTVGHLPLALEIVARLLDRSPWQSLAMMADRLADASRRLDHLALKDLSVRAAFVVSWAALSTDLRRIFAALGLFHARKCSYAALAATAGVTLEETVEALSPLAALSLVQMEGPDRVRQHPLLADFAREQINDLAAAQSRWVAYYLNYAEMQQADPARIDAEMENLTAVVETLYTQQQWAQVTRLVTALHPTWVALAHYARARRGYALAIDAASHMHNVHLQAQALICQGYACQEQSDYAEATTCLRAGLHAAQAAGNDRLAATAQLYLARIAIEQADLEKAENLLSECYRTHASTGDEQNLARTLREQGLVAYRRGGYATTTALCRQALIVLERLGDRAGILSTLRLLADTAMATGDLAQAMVYGQRSLALAQAADLLSELAEAHFVLATANRLLHNLAEANYHAELALALFTRFGNRSFTAYTLYEQSIIQKLEGRVDAALPLAQRAYAIQAELGDSYGRVTTLLHLGDLYELLGELEIATATWCEGWMLAEEIRYPYMYAFETRLGAEPMNKAGMDPCGQKPIAFPLIPSKQEPAISVGRA